MKVSFTLLLCTAAYYVSNAFDLPHLDGHFFYADFTASGPYGMHQMQLGVGDYQKQQKVFNVLVTTSQFQVGLITDNCRQQICDVPDKINSTKNDEAILVKKVPFFYQGCNITSANINLNTGRRLTETKFDGNQYATDFGLVWDQWHRKTHFEEMFLGLDFSSVSFKTPTSGWIGLAPYTSNLDEQYQNFMSQLKGGDKISHNVVSFYISNAPGNSSVIKFGSWDTAGMAPNASMTMFRTRDLSSWQLKANQFAFGNQDLRFPNQVSPQRYIDIDPQYPYLYIPDEDWISIAERFSAIYRDQGVICEFEYNYCLFEKPCSQVNVPNGNEFRIRIYDVAQSMDLVITLNQLLIPGPDFGDTNNRCYIPVFRSELGSIDTWQVGAILAQNYYLVYDMTPYDERHQNFIQLGIAPINPVQIIGDQRYQPNAKNYEPLKESDDSSRILPNYTNQYQSNDPSSSTKPGGTSSGTVPSGGDNTNNSVKAFLENNMMKVIIAGSVVIFLLIALITCFCCRKKKKDPYMHKTYSGDGVKLDDDNEGSSDNMINH